MMTWVGLFGRWTSCAMLVGGALLLMVGCTSSPKKAPRQLTGDALLDGQHFIENGPERDKVLWQYRTALAALRQGQLPLARQYLDDAIARLQGIYGKDAEARKARGYFREEARKTFIGEPYERSMAWFYRGVLYWMDGEADNARACFRSGQLMDSDTEEKTYAGDYVLLDYLDGYISAKLGGDATAAFRRAETNAHLWKPPAFSPKANLLVFVDYGPGPTKYSAGEYREQLRFAGGKSPVVSASVKLGSVAGKAVPYDDLYFQASTRGGRVMDHVLANKAVFKKSTDIAGTAGIVSGAVLATSHNRDMQTAGLAVLGAGVVTKIFSSATTPAADVRAWDNLPLFLSFVAFEVTPGEHAMTVEFQDDKGRTVPSLTRQFTVNVPAEREKVIYVSDKSKTPQTL
jgi:tetratricopeptide (TPR) repeat protein